MHPAIFLIVLISSVFIVGYFYFIGSNANPIISLIESISLFLFSFFSFLSFITDEKGGFWIITSFLMLLVGLYWLIDLIRNYPTYKKEYEQFIDYMRKRDEINRKEAEKSKIEFEKKILSGGYSSSPNLFYSRKDLWGNVFPVIDVYFNRNYSAFLMRIYASSGPIVIEVNSHSVTKYDYSFTHHYEGMDPATGALGGGIGGGYLGALIGGAIANGHEQVDKLDLIIGIKNIGTYTITLVENFPVSSKDVKDAVSFVDRFRNEILNHNFYY